MIERCPLCETGSLNTPAIMVRGSKRTRVNMPFRVCRHCKIVIITSAKKLGDWTIWSAGEKLDL